MLLANKARTFIGWGGGGGLEKGLCTTHYSGTGRACTNCRQKQFRWDLSSVQQFPLWLGPLCDFCWRKKKKKYIEEKKVVGGNCEGGGAAGGKTTQENHPALRGCTTKTTFIDNVQLGFVVILYAPSVCQLPGTCHSHFLFYRPLYIYIYRYLPCPFFFFFWIFCCIWGAERRSAHPIFVVVEEIFGVRCSLQKLHFSLGPLTISRCPRFSFCPGQHSYTQQSTHTTTHPHTPTRSEIDGKGKRNWQRIRIRMSRRGWEWGLGLGLGLRFRWGWVWAWIWTAAKLPASQALGHKLLGTIFG